MLNSCVICCETYNNSTHAKILCEYVDCQKEACKTCVRTYLVGTTSDPNCMHCKKTWSEEFIVKNLNKTFCQKEYKEHRKQLLLERELSKLPETMIFAEQSKKVSKEQEEINILQKKMKELNLQLSQLKHEKEVHLRNIYNIKTGKDPDYDEKRKFIMSCSQDGCRGFLSSQYKCGQCEMFTCPHCLELIGESKDIEHTCNPDNVSSAEFIKKDTKPCPQCGTRIHKIAGCSQMWCTQCHVAFDYNTGKIDTGHIHNPEYYRYLQEQGGGAATRNPGDVICGGLTPIYNITRTVVPTIQHAIYKIKEHEPSLEIETEYNVISRLVYDMHRAISHISNVELVRFRTTVRELEDLRDIRVDYILNKITKDEMKSKIYQNDVKRKKAIETLHLYELLNTVGIETFNNMLNECNEVIQKAGKENKGKAVKTVFTKTSDAEKFIDFINERITVIDNLRIYCNKRFQQISVTYNQSVSQICHLWKFQNKKFKVSDIVKD